MSDRRLISVRRAVEAGSAADYDAAWEEVVRVAARGGIHAWRYRRRDSPGSYIEFLEYPSAGEEDAVRSVMQSVREMDRLGRGTIEEWTEATRTGGKADGTDRS